MSDRTRDTIIRQLTREGGRTEADATRLVDGLLGREHPVIRGHIMSVDDVYRYVDDFALLESRSRMGWVSREGQWLGCAYAAHDRLAFALGIDPSECERQGWARVGAHDIRSRFRLTSEQRRAVRAKGHVIDDVAERMKPRFGETFSSEDFVARVGRSEIDEAPEASDISRPIVSPAGASRR